MSAPANSMRDILSAWLTADGAGLELMGRVLGERESRRYREAFEKRLPLLDVLASDGDRQQAFASSSGRRRRALGGAGRIVAQLEHMPHESDGPRDPEALREYLLSLSVPALDEKVRHDPVGVDRDSAVDAVVHDLINELVSFDSTTLKRATLEGRLSELLDLFDVLALHDAERTLACAEDYSRHDRSWRARRLLRARLRANDGEVAVLAALAACLRKQSGWRRRWREIRDIYREAISASPDDMTLRAELGAVFRDVGRVQDAMPHYEAARLASPDDASLEADAEQTRYLVDVIDAARADDAIPTLTPSVRERDAGKFDTSTLAVISRLYRQYGTLRFDGIFDPAVLGACHDEFVDSYREYFGKQKKDDALQIGDRRFQVSLTLDGPFNDPRFYANPFLLGVMRRLIGDKVIIGSTVCATSLPGARDQHLHKDHRALFTADADDEPMVLPPVAVTAMIPLVPLDENVGTTIVRKGSHRLAQDASGRLPEQAPCLPLGSCFLMDLSLSHRGQGNRSDKVRPIVNMQYTQAWFVDNKNFEKQRPLHVPRDAWKDVPSEHRKLFSWAAQPTARVGR